MANESIHYMVHNCIKETKFEHELIKKGDLLQCCCGEWYHCSFQHSYNGVGTSEWKPISERKAKRILKKSKESNERCGDDSCE